jgi:hypothetical protein
MESREEGKRRIIPFILLTKPEQKSKIILKSGLRQILNHKHASVGVEYYSLTST